jgi:hypothetical protein
MQIGMEIEVHLLQVRKMAIIHTHIAPDEDIALTHKWTQRSLPHPPFLYTSPIKSGGHY